MAERIRILHIEDVEDDALLALSVIQKADIDVFHKRIESKQAMVDAFDAGEWDVILADYNLPHFSAFEALVTLHEMGLDLPFIVVSGTIGEEMAAETMRAGAHDYVMKDNLARLPSVIQRELADAHMRAEKRQNDQALFESERQLRNKVAQQDAILAINQAVQKMTTPEDLSNVVCVCFDQFQTIGLDFLAVAIKRIIDPINGVFTFYEAQPSGRLHLFTTKSPNIFRKWRLGKMVYRPNLDEDMGGLIPKDRHDMSARYGQQVNSILNICFDMGVMSLLCNQVDPFSASQIAFLEQAMLPISIGMHRLRDMEQLDAVVRHLPEGVCLFDSSHQVVFSNELGKIYLTQMGIDLQGKSPVEIDGLSLELLNEATQNLPHQMIFSNETGMVLEVVVRPTREGSDGSSGWVAVFRDVTRELQAERISQRQDRLASIGQLAAGIAHDFNNMLTVMSGFAQILEMNPDFDAQTKEDLAQIREQGQRGANLVRQILDFSRDSDVERQPLDILPFLKESVKLFQRTLPENISIGDQFLVEHCVILTNITQLQQILYNLAVNARDAMPNGGEIELGAEQVHVDLFSSPPIAGMNEGEWLKIFVKDNGCGMTPEVLSHVFEPFFSTKKAGQGTGLGLAQVYGLVKQHDGFVDIESTVGKGTTVFMYFPLIPSGGGENDMDEALPMGNREQILIVEDNDEVLMSLQRMLEHLNYKVLTAHSAETAMPLILSHHIDAIFSDLIMSDGSGLDLFENLRNQDINTPLTIMTGYPSEAKHFEARIKETNGLILKPLGLQMVATQVNDMLQSRSLQGG